MRANIDNIIVKPNIAFTAYFIVMFCLYTNTYIQLLAQIGIVVYVLIPILQAQFRISIKGVKRILFYLSWFGLFSLLLFVSKYWAYSTYAGSKTMITVLRICVIGLVVVYYVNTKERAIAVLQSFIIGCVVMGLAALATTPISMYGMAGSEEGFGNVIGQHRNQIGAVAAPLIFACYYLYKQFSMRYGKLLAVYFAVLTLLTGSRSSILQLVIIFVLIMLVAEKSVSKQMHNALFLALAGIFAVILLQNIPFLYEIVWLRMENALSTVIGKEIVDTSAQGREFYKTIAFIMFKQRPFIGFGLDGFVCFLRDHPMIMGKYIAPVYSHCNYAEIAADLGILGLIVWYIPIGKILIGIWKRRERNKWTGCLFSIFASMVILDYSRIPWQTHLVMYLWIIIILLCQFECNDFKKTTVQK